MAVLYSESFEGTNGTALSSSNSVFTDVLNAPIFSTAVTKSGTSSVSFATTGSYSYAELTSASRTSAYWSFYIHPTTAPSANTAIFYVGTSHTTTDRIFQVVLNTNLTLKVQQGSSAIILGTNTSSALPLNEWSRIDISYAGGALYMDIYAGDANCDHAAGTQQPGDHVGGTLTNAAFTYMYIGVGNGTTNQFYIDELRADSTALPGPISVVDPERVVFTENFDNGTNGASITSANTGFDSVINSPVFSTDAVRYGQAAAYFNTTGTYAYLERSFSSATTRYWSFYVRPAAAPSANTPIFYAGTSHDAADRTFQVTFNTDRTLKIQQGASAILLSAPTSSPLPLNEWSRVDVSYVNGTLHLDLYPGENVVDSDINTAVPGDHIGGVMSSLPISYISFGVTNGTTNQLYLDEFREDSAGIPAPIAPVITYNPYLYYDNGTEWIDVSDQLYYDNGTTWVRIEQPSSH